MSETTVFIENAIVFVALGYALNKTRKAVLLIALVAVFMHMLFDNVLMNTLNIYGSNYDNMVYYWLTSFFFLFLFGVFLLRMTRLSMVLAGCMLAQSVLSFMMAINGAALNGVTLPEYDMIYVMHEVFNSCIWVVELIVVWIATTTVRK